MKTKRQTFCARLFSTQNTERNFPEGIEEITQSKSRVLICTTSCSFQSRRRPCRPQRCRDQSRQNETEKKGNVQIGKEMGTRWCGRTKIGKKVKKLKEKGK